MHRTGHIGWEFSPPITTEACPSKAGKCLTYVEFGIREPEPTLYAIMFASVLIMNLAFPIDAYREVKAADAERVAANQGTLGADTPQAS